MTKRELVLFIGILLLAFLIRGFFLSKVEVILPDEAYYIRLGEHLVEGKAFKDFDLIFRGFKAQPVYPYLVGLTTRLGNNPLAASQWASMLVAVLTLIPFHFSVKSFCSAAEALWSDLVYALSPLTIQYSLWVMNHSLFNFLLATILLFVLKAQRKGRLLWAVLAGGAACAAYLIRVEGIVFAVFLILVGILFKWPRPQLGRGSRFRLLVGFSSAFVILSLPFLIWLRKASGFWQLMWSEGAGTHGIFLRLLGKSMERGGFTESSPFSFLQFYLRTLHSAYSVLPRALPLLIWVFIAFGFVETLRRDKTQLRAILTAVLFAAFPLFFYPAVFGMETRFASPTLLFSQMFAGPGIFYLYHLGMNFLRGKSKFFWPGLLLLNFIPGYGALFLSFKEEPLEQRRLGEWIQNHFESPQVLFSSDSRTCFYAGRLCKRVVSMAEALEPLQKGIPFEQFLVQEKVDLAVTDTRYLPKFYPAFKFLLTDLPKSRFVPLAELTERGKKITLYQFIAAEEGIQPISAGSAE